MDTVSTRTLVDMIAHIVPIEPVGIALNIRKGAVQYGFTKLGNGDYTLLSDTCAELQQERYVSLRDYWAKRLAKAS